MMTFEPQGAHSSKVALAAQCALKSWGAQKPTIGEFPRPNRLLGVIASMGVGVLLQLILAYRELTPTSYSRAFKTAAHPRIQGANSAKSVASYIDTSSSSHTGS